MKKFTLTLVAALIAVVSFAQISAKEHHVNPMPMKLEVSKIANPLSTSKSSKASAAKKISGKKAVRKAAAISTIDELAGEHIVARENYGLDDENKLTPSVLPREATYGTIEVTGENTISISGIDDNAVETTITATVDVANGTISIADGQLIWTHDTYGNFVMKNAEADGPITGTILEGGIIQLDQVWYEQYMEEGSPARNGAFHGTKIAPVNAMLNETVPLFVEQDPTTKAATVWNYGNGADWGGLVFVADIMSDKTFTISTEQVVYYHNQYGAFNLYCIIGGYLDEISGVVDGTKLTSTNTTIYVYQSGLGGFKISDAAFGTIELIDGNEFECPAQEIGELVTPPDGLTTTDWPISANNFYVGGTNTGSYSGTVKLGIVGTDVYIQGMDSYLPEAWVKGTYDAETKKVTIPVTYMGIHENVTHYMGGYSSDGPKDIVLTYDEEDNTYSTSGSVMIYKGSATTASVAFYNGLLIGTPPTPVTAPDGLVTEDMPFKGKLNGATTETEGTVKVGFVDNDVYIQGLFNDVVAAGWIKGTISDGKATFPVNQYIGNRSNGTRVYLVGYANSTVGDVVFNYDATNKFFTATGLVIAATGKNTTSYYAYYSAGMTIGTQPDGINAINADVKSADEGAWYTVNGVRVAAPTQKGLYIHNGKKVVIK